MKKLWTIIVALLLFSAPKNVSAQVVINEISTNTGNDWVELYSIEEIDISGWLLMDDKSDIGTIPEGTILSEIGSMFYVVEVSNRLNKGGDDVRLFHSDKVTLVDMIEYGGEGEVCLPSDTGSIGRYPDGNATVERFSSHTKDVTNNTATIDACPTPTPEPTEEPTPEATTQSTSTQTPTKAPTLTPKSTVLSKATSKPKKTKTPKPTPTKDPKSLVLSDLDESTPTPTGSPDPKNGKGFPYSALLFVGGGIAFLGSAGYVFYKNQSKYNETNGKEKVQ